MLQEHTDATLAELREQHELYTTGLGIAAMSYTESQIAVDPSE
jgi:hypothetical protein